jgi:hypothetical protein
MSVTYDTTLKNTRMTSVRDDLNSGTLEICTAAFAAVLATFTFAASSGSVASGVLTFAFVASSVTASGTGTAAVARAKNSGGARTVITGLTVGTSGQEINLNSVGITSGQTVTLTSAAITHG